jgi:hypothetical protein
MSHFMLYKPLNWQATPNTRKFAKDTQAEILKIAAEIAAHQDNCAICRRNFANAAMTVDQGRQPQYGSILTPQ